MRYISGVNHLAARQNLTFSATGLTIVYGANGSGKSGYARILKRICRTRNPGAEILNNIYAPPGASVAQQATIDYAVGGTAEPPLVWSDTGIPHPVLSAVGIFDSSCTAVHIGNRNEIAARSFGLDIPDELADVSKRLEERFAGLKDQQDRNCHAIFTKTPWKLTTEVGKALAALTAESDLGSLRTLGELTVEEQKRLQQLKEDLARDPEVAARQIRVRIGRIRSLSDDLQTVKDTLSDTNLGRKARSREAEVHSDRLGQPIKQATDTFPKNRIGTLPPTSGFDGIAKQQLFKAIVHAGKEPFQLDDAKAK